MLSAWFSLFSLCWAFIFFTYLDLFWDVLKLIFSGQYLVFTLTVHCSGWPLPLNQLLKMDIFLLLFKTQFCIQKSLMSLAK